MSGMLPGVECARRRRIHGRSDPFVSGNCSTRRSSYCLYVTSHESHLISNSSMRGMRSQRENQDGELEGVAREAKERLDERLRSKWKIDPRRASREKIFEGEKGSRKKVYPNYEATEMEEEESADGLKRFRWLSL